VIAVTYEHQVPYNYDLRGISFPILILRLSLPGQVEPALDIEAYLDSGAEKSLIEGSFATALGIELLSGRETKFVSTNRSEFIARLHRICLSHPTIGSFDLEVGFSTASIARNLLGRDFFNLVQIGFRERQLTFYISSTP